MKPRKLLFISCTVVLCALTVAAAGDDVRDRVASLEKTVTADTATRSDRLELARAYIDAGRYYEAQKLATSMVESDPTDTEAAALRDRATEQLKLIATARLEDAQAAARREGATDADRLELANAYFSAGRYREAAEEYGRLPAGALTREARLRQARALSWSGNMRAAEERYAALLAEEPSPDLEREYGRTLSWMGAGRASIRRLESAHAAMGTDASVTALANARAWNGDREGAIRLLEEYTAAHSGSVEAQKLLGELRTSPDLAIERIDRQIDADPFNLALHMQRARLLYDARRYAQALASIEFIRDHATASVDGLDELQRQAEEGRRAEIAELDARRRALLGDPPMYSSESANASAMLELAKGYTGAGAYDQSIDLYDAYLHAVPNDMEARLNYARVLSWDRRYGASRRQYELVLNADPNRPDLRLEYAQVLAYESDYVPAVRTLRALTDVSSTPRAYLYEDVPSQAHYRLGQIYRWYGWRDTAIEQQNQALALDGTLVDAHREIERSRFAMPGSNIEARYTSEVNSNDFQTRRGDLLAEHWVNPRLAVSGGVGRHNFEQAGLTADANVAHVGAAWRQHDRLTYRGRVGATFWQDGDLGVRPYFGLGAEYLPNIQSRAALDYNHYDLIYDVSNIFSLGPRTNPSLGDPLSIDDFRAHYDWTSGGFWSFLTDGSYGRISDSNSRQALHGLLSFRVLKAPFVALKADGRMLSYDHRSNRYWSPDDYRSLAGVVQVGQDIRDRVFWTAELKVGRSWENERSSDLRAWAARVTVPVGDAFDVIGSYNYGRSGRFESLIGDPEFATYWQRSWYVGVRIKRLRGRGDVDLAGNYYYDNRVLTGSDVIPPEVR
jgi:tetratricopeptide (TPR) repeat protein